MRAKPWLPVLFTGAVVALAPASALAGEVRWTDSPEFGPDVTYEAADGETNDVVVAGNLLTLTITENGAGATMVDADGVGGCEVVGQTASCPNAGQFNVVLGDLDDAVDASAAFAGGNGFDGGDGADTLVGTGGFDELMGGAGADTINAGDGGDWADGGPGDDQIWLEGDDDMPSFGGDGDDMIDGGEGDDGSGEGLRGNDGNDTIIGGPGNDTLADDNLGETPSPGGDALYGGDGDDLLQGGPGPDLLDGGTGFDTVQYGFFSTPSVTVTIGDGLANDGNANDGAPGVRDNVLGSVERIEATPGDDTLVGGASGNELLGYGGDDVLDGAGGGDDLRGGDGNDTLTGGPGQDSLSGERGDDTLNSADAGPDVDQCGIGADSLTGDAFDMVFADCETVVGAAIGGPVGPAGPAGSAGPIGPAGPAGSAGPAGQDGQLVLVAYQARVTTRRVTVRYALTGPAEIALVVDPPRGKTRTVGTAAGEPGLNSVRWNRRLGSRRAPRGRYRISVVATSGDQTATSTLAVRLR